MSIYTYLKKYAKRKAGCWGRINHKRDMRAASKAVRRADWDDYWYGFDNTFKHNGDDNETSEKAKTDIRNQTSS